MRTAGGEAWKKGDHTRRDKEEKRGEAKGVDNTHISIRYPHPLLSPSIPFCPRTLSNHSEREQPTEQAVPRLLNVIKSSLPPSRPPPNRLDSFPPPFSSVRFGFLGLREDSIASRVQLVRLVGRFIGKPAFSRSNVPLSSSNCYRRPSLNAANLFTDIRIGGYSIVS